MNDSRAEIARLEGLVAELIASQEAERSDLAGELQHQMAQHLTALKYHLEGMRGASPEAITQRAAQARTLVDGLVDWVRRLSLQLRPSMLDDLGLRPALDWYVECFQNQTGVRVQVQHRGLDQRFPPEVETAAFRVTQELLKNVAEHAGTKNASLRLWSDESTLGLQVEDDGVGFPAQELLAAATGRGLVRVQQRVTWLGGSFDLRSAPGEGTRVTVQFPLARRQEGSEAI
jgi:signal transduction histidine kinase